MKEQMTDWFVGLAKAVAVAAVLGGGATVLTTQKDVAVLEHRVEQVEAAEAKIDKLNENLAETNKNIAVLNERLQRVSP
jgi:uncharacterized protein (DUF342 family)